MGTLDTRIDIFKKSGILSDAAAKDVERLLSLFSKVYGIELTEENAGPFVTHFCMALSRRENGDDILPMPDELFEEIELNDNYESAVYMANGIDSCIAPLPENERRYVLLHIVNLIENLKRDMDNTL